MMPSKVFTPFLIVNRLAIMKNHRFVYDERFHTGVNIIRGGNSSGKSTIADFIFYALGGSLVRWKEEALTCEYTYIEVNINGEVFTFKREIDSSKQAGMDIIQASLEDAQSSPQEYWKRYPYNKTTTKQSFYKVIIDQLGIPFVKVAVGDREESITLHQLLRLMYVDQMTSPDRMFKIDGFDTALKRQSVGDLLIGISGEELITARSLLHSKRKKKDKTAKEIQAITRILGGKVQPLEAINQQMVDKQQQIYSLEGSIAKKSSEGRTKDDERKFLELSDELDKLTIEYEKHKKDKAKLDTDIFNSERFINSLHSRLKSLNDSKRCIDTLSNIGYQFCPACFAPVTGENEADACSLCHTKHEPHSKELDPTFKIRQEIEFQIDESTWVQKRRYGRREKIQQAIDELEPLLNQQQRKLEIIRKPIYEVSRATKDAYIEIGQLNSEIKQLELSKNSFAQLYELQGKEEELSKEIIKLERKVRWMETSNKSEQEKKKAMISDLTKAIIKADLNKEKVFMKAEKVDFDFGADWVSVDGHPLFSASSMVLLKNAFRVALLQASCMDDSFRYPRFLLMDNVEDKGMQQERSHAFQKQVIKISDSLDVSHQIIFTTSMVAPELMNDSRYCIGDFYDENNKTLNLLT